MTLLAEKFEAVDTAMNIVLVERPREIHTALLALVSRTHHAQIGPPGCAKTKLARTLIDLIDGLDYTDSHGEEQKGYFQWLLTRYSTPEELFGPPSLAALEHDRYERNTHHKLPVARVGFLDEFFRGNSSILNTLLTILNERLFFNNGIDEKVPLSTLFTASNTEADGDELFALWDRVHFRHEIKPIQDGGNFVRMLQQAYASATEEDQKLITWDEIVQAQVEVSQVKLPSDIFDGLKTLRDNLSKEGVEPSERRFVEALRIIQAEAYLNNREIADIDDLRPLRHVMWSQLKDQRAVERVVLELANPIDKEATDLLERVASLGQELKKVISEGDNPKQIAKEAVEVHAKLHKAKQRMKDLEKRVEESGRKSETLVEVKKLFIQVAKELMTSGFGVSSDDVRL